MIVTEDFVKGSSRDEAKLALLNNRNLTEIWNNMCLCAATMNLRPMSTHYIDMLNYKTNFII